MSAQMKRGFFVTGTDTDIGKTWAAISLMHALRRQGYKVAGMKPVAAGCEMSEDGIIKNSDAVLLQSHSSVQLPYQQVNPYAFAEALSPHVAAEGVVINAELISRHQTAHWQEVDYLVVEGAGGWYSPVDSKSDNAFLAQIIDLPIILVVGMRLGCINHARLTMAAIRHSGMPCAGWIAVQISSTMPAFSENLAYLRASLNAPFLGLLPYSRDADFAQISKGLELSNWSKFDARQNS